MATTTTNYGFDVPTSSDLVKNGATQIALLGQDLDTFLFRPITQNGILNSSFNVWQRGTSVAASAAASTYTADRWSILSSGNATTTSRQVTGDTTNLPNIQYCARVQRNAGQTSTNAIFYGNSFETINSIPFVGKQVTLSYYARRGANYSAASNNLSVILYSGTGTDQSITGTYTGAVAAITITQPLTTTWQRFSGTGTISASATEIAISPSYSPTGTAGAADYFEITGIQLEVGNQMTPYTPATPTYATELAACQRYYYRVQPAAASAPITTSMYWSSSTIGIGTTQFPVKMRIIPTALEQSGTASDYAANYSTTTAVCSAIPIYENGSADMVQTRFTIASGATAGFGGYARQNSSGNAYLGWSAEL
jgi:hypothetical protein